MSYWQNWRNRWAVNQIIAALSVALGAFIGNVSHPETNTVNKYIAQVLLCLLVQLVLLAGAFWDWRRQYPKSPQVKSSG